MGFKLRCPATKNLSTKNDKKFLSICRQNFFDKTTKSKKYYFKMGNFSQILTQTFMADRSNFVNFFERLEPALIFVRIIKWYQGKRCSRLQGISVHVYYKISALVLRHWCICTWILVHLFTQYLDIQ